MSRLFPKEASGRIGGALKPQKLQGTPSDPGYFWAGRSRSFKEEACKHLVAVGCTGSGKSITLNLLLQSVLCKMGLDDGVKRRVLVYDPKADMVKMIAAMLPEGKTLRILNPLDARFAPWKICADVTTETDALEFAAVMIPRNEKESSPYFTNAARALLAGVMKRFIATGSDWSLRDVILAFRSQDILEQILTHEETDYLLDHFRKDNAKNFAGVKSTVDTVLAIYRPLAALLELKEESPELPPVISRHPLSLKNWLEEDSVLVLGNHEAAREATDTLNRLLFHQLSKLIITREGTVEKNETWIFLDEVREAGKLEGLRQLLLRGRSKGVAVVLGFQDVQGMYAVYGEHEGAEIVGAAQNVIMLHINPSAPETAEWASKVFGSRRDALKTSGMSFSIGQQGQGLGTSEQKMPGPQANASSELGMVENLLPIQLAQLDMPSPEVGLPYFAYTKDGPAKPDPYEWSWLEEHGPFKYAHPQVENFKLQAGSKFKLRNWEEGELFRRFGIRPPAAVKVEPASQGATTASASHPWKNQAPTLGRVGKGFSHSDGS